MKLSTKVAYNTIIQFLSKLISTALGLAAIAIITRYLGQVGFGEYTTAITFISFFAIVADFGLTLVTVQMISMPGADENRVLGNLLGLRLASAGLLLGLGVVTVAFFPYSAEVKLAVAVVSLSFLFIALNQVLVGLFQKRLRLDKVSWAEVISRIALVAAVVLVIRLDYGLLGIMAATAASSALSFLLHFLFSRSFARIGLRFEPAAWKRIMVLAWPLAITIGLNLLYLKSDTLLLSVIKRPSELGIIAEVGIYGAAYKVIDVLITFPFMFAGIILPILTLAHNENDREKFKSVLQRSFDLMAILALPLVLGAQLMSKEIMVFVAGPEFAVSGPVLRILILAAAAIFLGVMFSHAIIAINKQRRIIGAYVFTAVTSLAGYFLVIPRWSYFGAAWLTVYSEAVIALAAVWLVYKYTGFRPRFSVALRAFTASIIMFISIYFIYIFLSANLFLVLGLAVLVYFAVLYLLGGLGRSDILTLFNRG